MKNEDNINVLKTIFIGFFIVILSSCAFANQGIQYSADRLFSENDFEEALVLYSDLIKSQDLRFRSSAYYQKARCEYYLQRYDEAAKTIQVALDDSSNSFKLYTLLGKVHFDAGEYKKAITSLETAIEKHSWFDDFNDLELTRDLLARVYEEIGFRYRLTGDVNNYEIFLKKALIVLEEAKVDRGASLSHQDPLRHRIVFLEQKLKKVKEIGSPFQAKIKKYDWNGLQTLTSQYLSPEQSEIIKNPYAVDESIKSYVRTNLKGVDGEIEKARKLFLLFLGESKLRIGEMYDQYLQLRNKEFFLGRTAQNVFHEKYQGNKQYGQDPDLKYRYGDCESLNNLYIAMAREAGLNAHMVRIFRDINQGFIGQHRGVGIVTQDKKLIIVDFSWYASFDAPYKEYRVLDDKQALSYYMIGYNNAQDSAQPYIDASLKLLPENELALLVKVNRLIDAKDFGRARKVIKQIPEYSWGYDLYWLARFELEKKQNNLDEAGKVLDAAEKHVKYSPTLLHQRALLEKEQGNDDLAIDYLRKSIEAYPLEAGEKWYAIGDIEKKRGNSNAAIEAYMHSLRFDHTGKVITANNAIGNIYWEERNYLKALQHYVEVLNADRNAANTSINSGMNKLVAIILKSDLPKRLLNKSKEVYNADEYQKVVSAFSTMKDRYSDIPVFRMALINLHNQRHGNAIETESRIFDLLKYKPLDKSVLSFVTDYYYEKGDLLEALKLLHTAIEENDENIQPELWYKLGLISRKKDLLSEAKHYFLLAEKTGYSDLEAINVAIGDCEQQLKNYTEAEKRFLKVLQFNPKNKSALRLLPYVYLQLKSYSATKKYLDLALKEIPSDSIVYRIALKYYVAMNKYAEGSRSLEKLIREQKKQGDLWIELGDMAGKQDDHKKAIEYYKLGEPEFKNKSGLYSAYGWNYQELGEEEKALEYYERSIKANKSNISPYYRILTHFSRKKECANAKEVYNRFYNHNSSNLKKFKKREIARLDYNLAGCFKNINDIETAKEYYEKSIQTDGTYSHAILKLADTYHLLNLKKEAAKTYHLFFNSESYDLELLKSHAGYLMKKDRFEQSLPYFKSDVDGVKDSGILWFGIAEIAGNLGRSKLAILCYKNAEPNYKDKPKIYNAIGDMHYVSKAMNKAKSYYQMSYKLDPENKDTLSKLGFIYKVLGEWQKAEKYYLEYYNKDQSDVFRTLNVVETSLHLKDENKAREFFEKALQLDSYHAVSLVFPDLDKLKGYEAAKLWILPFLNSQYDEMDAWSAMAAQSHTYDHYQDAVMFYKQALSKFKTDNILSWTKAGLLHHIGKLYSSQNDYIKAELFSKKALASVKEGEDELKPYVYESLISSQLSQNKFSDALESIKTFEKRISGQEKYRIKSLYGDYFYQKGDFLKARELYEASLKLNGGLGDNISAYIGLYNTCSSEEGKWQLIKTMENESSKSWITNLNIDLLKGVSLFWDGNYQEAGKSLDSLLKSMKTTEGLRFRLQVYLTESEFKKAEELINQNEVLLQQTNKYDFFKGYYYFHRGELNSARKYLKAAEKDNRDLNEISIAKWYLSVVDIEQGKLERSKNEVIDFIDSYSNPNAWLPRLFILELLSGNLDKARQYLDRYQVVYPNDIFSEIFLLSLAIEEGNTAVVAQVYSSLKDKPYFTPHHLRSVLLLPKQMVDRIFSSKNLIAKKTNQ